MTSIGFHGNIVTIWERLVRHHEETGELLVELASDQTSCHNPFNGGYYPVQLGYEQANEVSAKGGNLRLHFLLAFPSGESSVVAWPCRSVIWVEIHWAETKALYF